MTSKLAAFLGTLAYIATGTAGALIVLDPHSLGISSDTLAIVGGWLALGGSFFGIVVVGIRRNLLPGVTTGVGNETPGTTQTTTETTVIQPPAPNP